MAVSDECHELTFDGIANWSLGQRLHQEDDTASEDRAGVTRGPAAVVTALAEIILSD